jgi:hypothetical protein
VRLFVKTTIAEILLVIATFNPLFESLELTPLCDNNFSSYLEPARNAVLLFVSSVNCPTCPRALASIKQTTAKYRYRGVFAAVDVSVCPKVQKFFNVTKPPEIVDARYRDRVVHSTEFGKGTDFLKKVLTYPSNRSKRELLSDRSSAVLPGGPDSRRVHAMRKFCTIGALVVSSCQSGMRYRPQRYPPFSSMERDRVM